MNKIYGLLIIGMLAGLSNQVNGQATNKIDSTGNVGIGTLTPGYPLDVRGSIYVNTNTDAVLTFNNTDNSWQYMQFKRSGIRKLYMGLTSGDNFNIYKEGEGHIVLGGVGNVGIGTANPTEKLHVSGNFKAEENLYVNYTSYLAGSTGNGQGNLVLFGDGGNGAGWQSSILWSGMDGFGNGSGTRVNARIKATSVGTYGRADLSFYTKGTYDDALPTEKMRITKDGNVGIGITAPTVDLEVLDSGETHIRAAESTNNRYVQLYQQANDSYLMAGGSAGNYGSLRLYTGGTDRLAINSSGKVGIGTYLPNSLLHLSSNDVTDLKFSDTAAATDNGNWTWQVGNPVGVGVFRLRAVNDANTNGINAIEFTRTGISGISTSFNGGNVGIGTTTPDQKLTVAGTIKSKEIIVEETAGADFVFEEDYDLPSLAQIETFIKANKHLEGIASAKEMQANGVKVGELQIKLLQKIEELTLHVIAQEKRDKKKDKVIEELLKRIEKIEKDED